MLTALAGPPALAEAAALLLVQLEGVRPHAARSWRFWEALAVADLSCLTKEALTVAVVPS